MSLNLLPSNQDEAISQYVFITKYARYDHKKKRRETWDEAVDRVRDMHLQRYGSKGIEEDIKWAFEMVRNKKVLPSMRSMQFGGEAILANDARMYNCAYTLADRPRFFSETLWMLLSGSGVGFSVQKRHIDKLPKLIKYSDLDEKEIFTYTVADTIEGWADALDILMSTYFVGTPNSGREVFFDFSKIRRKGTWLKTSGGRAPGAAPLRTALKRIKKVLREATENKQERLRSIQIYDIGMMAADAVLSGGVRSSATIVLFSEDDEEMMTAKTFFTRGKVLSSKRKDGSWLVDYGDGATPAWFLKKDDKKTEPQKDDEINIGWSNVMPWRARSNNSVALLRKSCKFETFQNVIKNAKLFGEPGFVFLDNLDFGGNPCFSGDMKLLTENGYRTIKQLWKDGGEQVYQPNKTLNDYGSINIVNSNGVVKATNVYQTSESEPVYELTLQNNVKIKATAQHTFFTLQHKNKTINGDRRYYWERTKKKLNELKEGDVVPLNSTQVFGSKHDPDVALLAGWVIGDGTLSRDGQYQAANVIVYDKDVGEIDSTLRSALLRCYNLYNTSSNQNPTFAGYIQNQKFFEFDKMIMSSRVLGRLLKENGAVAGDKHRIPEFIWSANRETVAAFLKGFFSADGSVQLNYKKKSGSVRLGQANRQLLSDVQLLLGQFGIISTIRKVRGPTQVLMNDGKGGKKLYNSKAQYEIIIGKRENFLKFIKDIGYLQSWNNEALDRWVQAYPGSRNSHNTYRTKIKSIKYVGEEPVYCLTELESNEVCVQGVLTSQCLEIGLNPTDPLTGETGFQVCNLTEINGGAIKSKEDFEIAVKAATIIGTLQAGFSYFHYLTDASRRIIRRERLLGVSVTGWMDHPDLLLNPKLQREMAQYAIKVNQEYATKIGIESAARVTCTKPAGSTALILGTSSGIHPRHAKHYFRRIQQNEMQQALHFFKLHNPQAVERSVWSSQNEVVTFCVEVKNGAILKDDIGAIEFLKTVRETYLNWVVPGTAIPESSPGLTHNVSNTVQVADHEWDEVTKFIYDNRDYFSGISLISKSGDKIYAQAPHERVLSEEDAQRWNELVTKYETIDWTQFQELEDYTSLQEAQACANGSCDNF